MIIFLTLISFLIPLSSSAFVVINPSTGLNSILIMFGSIIWNILPLLLGIAVLVFIWGLIRYIKTNSESEKKEAVGIITYGIIALFVIVSIWGIIRLLQDTLGIPGLFGPGVVDVEIKIN